MGAQSAWVAVRGRGRAAVLDELQVRPTGEMNKDTEPGLCGLQLAGGWFLVLVNNFGNEVAAPLFGEHCAALRRLSREAEAVFCAVEEHFMYFEASHWRNGRPVWRVEYDPNGVRIPSSGKADSGGSRHLRVLGAPPPEFEKIRHRCFAQQDAADRKGEDVDYISSIPEELAEVITGFRLDRSPEEAFEVLESTGESGSKEVVRRGQGCMLVIPAALVAGVEWLLLGRR